MSADKWIWMGHAGHFILGHKCRFKLCTYVKGYIISTVGEYIPDNSIIDIYHPEFKHLKGDEKEHAYRVKYNCESIGCGDKDKYETMVFKAKESEDKDSCCPYRIVVEDSFDERRYETAKEATDGHYELCRKYDKKRNKK